MLIKFRIKNFKSFKELTELDLTKGKTRKNEERISKKENVDILKFGAIYGANASGKSNLVRALKVMQYIVCNGTIPIEAINEYYKLDDSYKNIPTYFETIISISNKIYSYGFEIYLSTGIIESEWLVELKKLNDGSIKEKNIFSRNNNNVEYYKKILCDSDMISTRLLVYMDDAKNDLRLLLLNRICKNLLNIKITNQYVNDILCTYNWFNNSLKVVYPINSLINPEIISSSIEKIQDILKAFDTGILELKNIDVSEEDFNNENIKYGFNTYSLLAVLNPTIRETNNTQTLIKLPTGLWIIKYNDGRFYYSKIIFLHDKDYKHQFTSSDESDGTMRLFELVEPLSTIDNETTFVIDELDRCLHPSLTLKYIDTFLARANQIDNNNQLIVTTHESRLLNLEKIRRDEIWFTEKTSNESKLYSLEEFNVRFDYVIDKAYMEGRFGGVPVFDKLYLSNIINNANK